MITRRDAILASFGLPAMAGFQFKESKSDQIIYVLRHPTGSCIVDGEEIPNHVIARTVVENIRPGSRVTLPLDWELKIFDLRSGKSKEVPNSLT